MAEDCETKSPHEPDDCHRPGDHTKGTVDDQQHCGALVVADK
jgi:hypothetical protein